MNLLTKLKGIISTGQQRSVLIKKNIIVSVLNKGISFIVSFLLVRYTINYVNPEQYGIWLTITSISYWISLFDFGLTNGLRNRLAESLSKQNYILSKKYISTTYVLLGIIFGLIAIIMIVANSFINWSTFLKLDGDIEPLLKNVFNIVIVCFCTSMVVRIIHTVFIADQRPSISAIVGTFESIIVLAIILILTKTTEGNLVNLAYANSGSKVIMIIIITIMVFLLVPRYSRIKPGLKYVDLSLSKDILVLGGKFLLIQISMLVIYQAINFIIMRNLGAESVTLYNVLYKYYGAVNTIFIVFLTPFWSASTDAYVNGDITWIRNGIKKMRLLFILLIVVQIILAIISPWLLKLWLNVTIEVPWSTNIMMAIYLLIVSYTALYLYFINGIGKITMQMIVYISYACVSLPLMIIGSKIFGLNAIIFVITILNVILIIIGKIQIEKILSRSAKGLWNK